jgi:hypothetical protein
VERRDEEMKVGEEKTRGKIWEMGGVYEIETTLETGLRLQSNNDCTHPRQLRIV